MKSLMATVALAGVVFTGASAAGAVECEDSSSSAVDCVQVEAIVLEPAVVTPVAQPVAPTPAVVVAGKQQLPVTGSDAIIMGIAGTALVLAGGVLVLRSRSVAVED